MARAKKPGAWDRGRPLGGVESWDWWAGLATRELKAVPCPSSRLRPAFPHLPQPRGHRDWKKSVSAWKEEEVATWASPTPERVRWPPGTK